MDEGGSLHAARAFLIFPGDDERKRVRALAADADAIVLDLEDGVAPDRKDAARAQVAAFALADSGAVRIVRVNDPSGDAGHRDLDAIAASAGLAVMVSKASPASVEAAAAAGRPLLALVEDAAALRDVHAIAAHPAVVALVLGSVDLRASLGLSPTPDGVELAFARSQLVVASAAAGIRPPVDGPCVEVYDLEAVEQEARLAATLGMRGKICIHPAQVPVARRALAPSPGEVERARRVVAAWEEMGGRGVGVVDGTLVELPTVIRAQAVLAAAGEEDEA